MLLAVLDACTETGDGTCAICGMNEIDIKHATDCPVKACIEAGLGK